MPDEVEAPTRASSERGAKSIKLAPFALDRMERAVEKVRDRPRRATAALEAASVSYAVVGGHAVAAWVSQIDESATRTTQNVDIMIRGEDLKPTRAALESVGFLYRHVASMDLFLDGPQARPGHATRYASSSRTKRSGPRSPSRTRIWKRPRMELGFASWRSFHSSRSN